MLSVHVLLFQPVDFHSLSMDVLISTVFTTNANVILIKVVSCQNLTLITRFCISSAKHKFTPFTVDTAHCVYFVHEKRRTSSNLLPFFGLVSENSQCHEVSIIFISTFVLTLY